MQQRPWFRTLQRWRFPLSAIVDALLWYGALFTAVLTLFYLLKVFSIVFLGELKHPAPEKTKSMVYVVAVLAVLSLAAGILVSYPMKLANIATTQMSWWLR